MIRSQKVRSQKVRSQKVRPQKAGSQVPAALLAVLGGFLLGGCDNDRPYSGPPPDGSGAAQPSSAQPSSAQPSSAPPPLAAAAPPPAAQDPNPLLPASGPADNPLLSMSRGGNPLTQNNPLVSGNPLHGPAMPTDHSHWLKGRIRDARLTVLLNGIRQGEYTGVVDQDITMKLRPGVNSVSFVYAPRRADASAQMDLMEGEHNPPVPPLVKFQSAPLHGGAVPEGVSSSVPAAQSFTFYAR